MSPKYLGIQWHITNKCDQRCRHCYIFNNKYDKAELNIEILKTILDNFIIFCKKLDCEPGITITGGDPILHKDFWDLLSYIKTKNILFTILGNPFHLDQKVCDNLYYYGCRTYQMSLDGLPETHDKLRMSGSFDATIEKIKVLKNSLIKPNIMSTISKVNYKELPELTKILVDKEVNVHAFARYCPTEKSDIKNYNIEPLEYRKFLDNMWKIYSLLAEQKTIFNLKDHLWTLYLLEEGILSLPNNKDNLIIDGCGCGFKHITLLPNGDIYACRRFNSLVGNILNESFEKIFFSKKMERYRNIQNLEGCMDCDILNYCRGCHAVSYGTYGNFFRKDPQCWK